MSLSFQNQCRVPCYISTGFTRIFSHDFANGPLDFVFWFLEATDLGGVVRERPVMMQEVRFDPRVGTINVCIICNDPVPEYCTTSRNL